MRMSTAVFDLIQEKIFHHLKKEATNFRQSLEVGLNQILGYWRKLQIIGVVLEDGMDHFM